MIIVDAHLIPPSPLSFTSSFIDWSLFPPLSLSTRHSSSETTLVYSVSPLSLSFDTRLACDVSSSLLKSSSFDCVSIQTFSEFLTSSLLWVLVWLRWSLSLLSILSSLTWLTSWTVRPFWSRLNQAQRKSMVSFSIDLSIYRCDWSKKNASKLISLISLVSFLFFQTDLGGWLDSHTHFFIAAITIQLFPEPSHLFSVSTR